MSAQDFFNQYNGKGIDFDGYFGFQCMDLFEEYNKDVVGCPFIGGNAIDVPNTYNKDFYEWIDNTPDGVPQLGDVVIWGQGVGQYGHIAVFKVGDQNNFTSFDQNWPLNSLCHFQSHNYNNVLGWLHPKTQVPDSVSVDKATFTKLVHNSSVTDEVNDYLGTPHDSDFSVIKGKLDELKNKPAQVITVTKEVPSSTTIQVPIDSQNTATTANSTPSSTNTVVTSPNQPILDGSTPNSTNPVPSGNWISIFINWLLGKPRS